MDRPTESDPTKQREPESEPAFVPRTIAVLIGAIDREDRAVVLLAILGYAGRYSLPCVILAGAGMAALIIFKIVRACKSQRD